MKQLNDKGMTLVEIIVSISLLGILAVGILTLMVTSMAITTQAGKDSVSIKLTGRVIENILSGEAIITQTETGVTIFDGVATTTTLPGYNYNVTTGQTASITYTGGKTSVESVTGRIVVVAPRDTTDRSKVEVFIPND